MKISTKILLVFFISFSFVSCRKHKLIAPCDCNNNELVEQDVNIEGKWIFHSLITASEKQEYSSTGLPEMNIEIDSIIKVRGTINSCFGSYLLFENNCITLDGLMCSEAGGSHDQMDWEDKYFNGLSNLECYKVKNDKLTMYYKNGTDYEMLIFRK